jgi:hypothetical protein
MKNKIFMLVLLGMILLSVSSVSALELNPFADKKIYEPILKEDTSQFLKEDFNQDYGIIRLSKTFFWFESDKIAEYSLIENTEQCLINCEARGKATLYQSGQLFDDLRFLGVKGTEKDLLNAKYLIKEIETYEVEVPDEFKEVCVELVGNGTKGETIQSCKDEVVSYKKESKEREVWNEYKGQILAPGQYEWKVTANKRPTERADFIPIARGKTFNEWAWWDGDWEYKKAITNTQKAKYVYLNVSYDVDMRNNFSDLRFVDNLETSEFPYWIQSKTDGNSAQIRVLTNGNDFYVYFGNSGASSKSNYTALYNSPQNHWTFDNVTDLGSGGKTITLNNGALIQSTKTKFGSGALFCDGVNDHATTDADSLDKPYTLSMWVYFETYADSHIWRKSQSSTPFLIKTNATRGMEFYQEGGSGGVLGNQTFDFQNWTYYTIVYNSSNTLLYKNGNLIGSEVGGNQNTLSAINSFCRNQYISSNYWHGYIDEAMIYRTSLNTTQISNLANVSNIVTFGEKQTSEGISVTLSSPANSFKSSSQTIFFNATITPTSANITNITWKADSQTDFQAYNTNATITQNWTKTFADGSYSWNVTACWIGNSEAESCTESATRTFEIDSIAPNLTLNAPLTNFTTLTLPINVTLNFTASDSNLQACWFSSTMNSTNTTFTCNTTQTREFNSSGAHSFTYYANDSFGGVSTGTAPFYIYYVQPSATSTNPITEGGTSTHTLFVNMTNIKFFPTSAYLIWNGTNHGAGTLTNVSNDSVRFDKTIIVPNINGTFANWTWFYNISGNPNVQNWNVSGSQTYIPINISECGAGTYRILNYTLYDQKTKVISPGTNASIEVDLTLTSYANSSQTWQFHTTKTASNNLLVCLPSGALNNSAYQLDSIAKYSYQDHVVQYHYIVNFKLNSTTIPQSIKLYNLATEQSTSFLVNYQDENYLYVEDAIIDVWRRYVGDGVFLSVEHGKTDAQGQTRLHLVTEDIIYKFLVWINGELVYTSPEYLALCQATPCQINLRKTINESDGFSERDNILYSYSFDKTTRTATFDFTTKDGIETTINMTILSSNAYANDTACTTTLTTSGGQISCAIPTAFTNTSYQTLIYKDGVFFGQSTDSLAPSSMELFGYTGVVLTAIAYLFLTLMGISSGIAIVVFGLIGLVLMGIIQMFESGSIFGLASAIIWLVVAGIIIIVKITKRRIQ